MKTLSFTTCAGACALVLALASHAEAAADPIAQALRQTDTNHDGRLSTPEVTAGLRRPLALRPGQNSPALQRSLARFRKVFGAGPNYPLQELAASEEFSEDLFGLTVAPEAPPVVNTTDRWVPVDEKPFRVRRTYADFLKKDKNDAEGATVSYTNDFNAKTEQWAYHGIIGLNLHQKRNVHLGQDAKGVQPQVDTRADFGVADRWFIPSVQWDKVTTTKSDADEIDSLIYRLTTGLNYDGKRLSHGVFDSFRFNVSAGYATNSDHRTGLLTGELDFAPIMLNGQFFGVGLNANYQRVGWFGVRPEFNLHAEGGTVGDDGGDPVLAKAKDFFRIGFNAGLGLRFEQVTGRFYALRRLSLHAGLDYLVDVTDSGPDVDLFTGSLDYALDDDGDYTLSVVYRNGRAPLVLDRYHDVTAGISVRF